LAGASNRVRKCSHRNSSLKSCPAMAGRAAATADATPAIRLAKAVAIGAATQAIAAAKVVAAMAMSADVTAAAMAAATGTAMVAVATETSADAIAAVMAERDRLRQHLALIQFAAERASSDPSQDRYSAREIKWVAKLDVAKLHKQSDDISAKLRELNAALQEANWKIELRA